MVRITGFHPKSCPALATPWIAACQAPLEMEFSRKEHWSGLPFPSSGDVPDPGIEPTSPVSPALQEDSLPTETVGKVVVREYLFCLASLGSYI